MLIVKIPLGISGCGKSPNEILKSLKEISVNEKGREINFQNLDIEEIHLENSNLKLSNELIYKNSFNCFETKPKTIFLGGEHSISYSTVRAFSDYCEDLRKKPCLIVFDAHADCSFEGGNFPTNDSWLRKLIEEGFPTENILMVGIRSFQKKDLDFLKKNKIQKINMNSIEEDIDNIADTIMEFANGKEVYVSLDFDVVDPVFVPAVENPEPGGLTSRQFIYLIQRINKMKNLRAVDIVEINSEKANFENKISKFPSQVREKDKDNLTIKLGAKILSEFL